MGDDQGIRRRLAVLLVALLTLAGVGAGGLVNSAQADALDDIANWLNPTTTTTTKPRPKTPVPAYTHLAAPPGDVATYDKPNGTKIGVAGHWYGYEQTFPIVGSQQGWLKIRLPERPNGKTAWIKSNYVKITRTPYRIVIRRGSTNLTLYKDGYPQMTFPVGLGVPKTPTPLGNFYLGVIEHDTGAAYGPFQLDSTGHSEAIQSWQGTGDAIIAIHGPINKKSDQQIGSKGTYISNGCVRMHRADLQRLAAVPIGTPIDIVQ